MARFIAVGSVANGKLKFLIKKIASDVENSGSARVVWEAMAQKMFEKGLAVAALGNDFSMYFKQSPKNTNLYFFVVVPTASGPPDDIFETLFECSPDSLEKMIADMLSRRKASHKEPDPADKVQDAQASLAKMLQEGDESLGHLDNLQSLVKNVPPPSPPPDRRRWNPFRKAEPSQSEEIKTPKDGVAKMFRSLLKKSGKQGKQAASRAQDDRQAPTPGSAPCMPAASEPPADSAPLVVDVLPPTDGSANEQKNTDLRGSSDSASSSPSSSDLVSSDSSSSSAASASSSASSDLASSPSSSSAPSSDLSSSSSSAPSDLASSSASSSSSAPASASASDLVSSSSSAAATISSSDLVSFSTYAPEIITIGEMFSLFLWAYLPEQKELMKILAQQTEAKQEIGSEEGIEIIRGNEVKVQLVLSSHSFSFSGLSSAYSSTISDGDTYSYNKENSNYGNYGETNKYDTIESLKGERVASSSASSSSSSLSSSVSETKSFIWNGGIENCHFNVYCLQGAKQCIEKGKMVLYVADTVVAIIFFDLTLSASASSYAYSTTNSYVQGEYEGEAAVNNKPGVDVNVLTEKLSLALSQPSLSPTNSTIHYVKSIFACYSKDNLQKVCDFERKLKLAVPNLKLHTEAIQHRDHPEWQLRLTNGSFWSPYDLVQVFWAAPAAKDACVEAEVNSALKYKGESFFQIVRVDPALDLSPTLSSISLALPASPSPLSSSNTQTSPLLKLETLTLAKEIGQGNFGSVHLAKWHKQHDQSGEEVAVKRVRIKDTLSQDMIMSILTEASLALRLSDNSHVVKFLGAAVQSRPSTELWMVSELMSNGSLLSYLAKNSSTITLKDRMLLSLGAAKGVAQLHACGVIHRDLAARNFLVDSQLNVKVSDFGMSSLARHQYTLTIDAALPFKWMAPESIRACLWSPMSDVWSLGVTIWEIFTGVPPFAQCSHQEAAFLIMNKLAHPLVFSPDVVLLESVKSLLLQCWNPDPLKRMTACQLANAISRLV